MVREKGLVHGFSARMWPIVSGYSRHVISRWRILACVSVVAVSGLIGAIPIAVCDGGAAPASPAPDSYQACIKAGGAVDSQGEARCTAPSGATFARPKETARSACKDLCGDGTCQEIVCMAVGCPCAESPQRCPQDCKQEPAGALK